MCSTVITGTHRQKEVLHMIGIYKITNLINGKVYIGQSTNIKRRWKDHRSSAFNPNSEDYEYPLYRDVRKYGFKNFLFEVLEECNEYELNEKEKFYIAKHDSYKNGYNQTEGGDSVTHNLKLTKDEVLAIIARLKTTRDNTTVIAKDFNVGATTIHYINIGTAYHQNNESYPIRTHLHRLVDDEENGGYKERNHDFKCIICGINVSNGCKYCVKCYPHPRKCNNRPNPIELARLVKEHGFRGVGIIYNVADRTIQSWCEDYNIPHRKTDLINWYNKQMGIQETIPVKKTREDYMKPVKQIDMNTGKVINTFRSAAEAGNYLGKSNGNHISEACRGKLAFAYGYYWEYVQK